MNTCKIRVRIGVLLLFFGICLCLTSTVYAAKAASNKKDLNIHMPDGVSQQGTELLFTGTIVWDSVSECSVYEIYRSDDGSDMTCVATISDGVCRYTDCNLSLNASYTYTIYACTQTTGGIVRTYYDQKEFIIGVAPVSRPNVSDDEVVTSSNRISVELAITDDTYVIKLDHLEVTRENLNTSATKKKKVAWTTTYTDSTVKPGYQYSFTFAPYCTINGEKVYSSSTYTETCYSYNSTPACDVEIETTNKTLVMKLKSASGNGVIVINNNDTMSRYLKLYAPKSKTTQNFTAQLDAVSYDGKNWMSAKKSLHVLLQENETVYLKYKIKGKGTLNVTGKKTTFSFGFRHMYTLNSLISDSRIIRAECKGNLKKKKFSGVMFD